MALWVAKYNGTPQGPMERFFHFSGIISASTRVHAKRAWLVHLEAMLKKIEENMNEAGWELPPVTLCQHAWVAQSCAKAVPGVDEEAIQKARFGKPTLHLT